MITKNRHKASLPILLFFLIVSQSCTQIAPTAISSGIPASAVPTATNSSKPTNTPSLFSIPSTAPVPLTEVRTSPGDAIGFNSLNLLEGRVVELGNRTIRIATDSEQVDLEISTSTVIWDDITWVAAIPTRTGDFITAWGVWNPDHSFAVRKLYVNIQNLQGKVGNVTRGDNGASFDLADQRQKSEHIIISPLTKIYKGSAGTEFNHQDNPILPRDGDYVEIIGRESENGSVLAVYVTLP